MKARVLYRTHYQVEEPAYMELLVKRCTSPVQAAYADVVSKKLAHEVSSRGRRFNISAAGYALDLAHGLGVLNENNTWTDKGHLLALNARIGDGDIERELLLDLTERLTHFRLFLEADGAALMHIARIALTRAQIPADHDWNSFSRTMFRDIYAAYLTATADIADRLALRRDLERFTIAFAGKTGTHKSYIHLQTMFRMGLLQRSQTASQRVYELAESAAEGLEALLDLIPTVAALEEVIEKGLWSKVAAAVFHRGRGREVTRRELRHSIASVYRRVSETGVPLCSITTLIDAEQIQLMTSGFRLLSNAELLDVLNVLQKDRPEDVRFHVDRRGRLAFVKMSEQLTEQLLAGASL